MGIAKHAFEAELIRGYKIPNEETYLCAECLNDTYLQNKVEEEGKVGICSYCNSGQKKVVPLVWILEKYSKYVSNHYQLSDELYFNDPEIIEILEEATWTASDVLYSFIEDAGIENSSLCNDIGKLITHDQMYHFNSRHIIGDIQYSWISFKNKVKHHSRYIWFMEKREEEPTDHSPSRMLELIAEMIFTLGLINPLPVGRKLYRGREKEAGYQTWNHKDLGPISKEKAINPNRMSAAGIPVFYGSDNEQTVIKEVGSNRKNLIVGCFECLKDLSVIDFSQIPQKPSPFDEAKMLNYYTYNFLCEFIKEISTPIDSERKEIEYVPTQIVVEYIRYYFERKGIAIDGFCYSSAVHQAGKCYALFIEQEQCTTDKVKSDKMLSLKSDSLTEYKITCTGQKVQ